MSRLNEFQGQHVETTFGHVDKLLNAVEALTRADPSPFAQERPDISPDEARFLAAFVQQMRTRMIAALDRLGLHRPAPTLSARNTADVTLRFAEVALADLSAKSLRGYGPVDPDAGAEVNALAADLNDLIQRGRALFHEQERGALAERLAQLKGPFGDALRALERFSDEQALTSVRPLIANAADRVMAETYDVGVFGRVSAGKSSLINALIGSSVLPVGATPVTAVPLRLHHGPAGATVYFDGAAARPIEAVQVPDYATEERNPGNKLRVQSIEIAVPTVPPGLRFLDTPGIGSLSTSGSAQAFAWLPRCDLGLVLIAAGTPVGTDDLALITGLVQAGIECQVLISKADMLKSDELEHAIAYVRQELASVIAGTEIAVHPISTAPQGVEMFRAFRATVLDPLAERHVRALHDALKSRLHRLVALTRVALAERTSAGMSGKSDSDETVDSSTRGMELQQHARRVSALATVRKETDQLSGRTDHIMEAAASAVASAWIEKSSASAAVAAARSTIIREAGETLSAIRRAVDESSGVTVSADRDADTAAYSDRRMPPVFDAAFLNHLPDLAPPKILAAPRHILAGRRLSDIREPLRADLERYAARLYAWGAQAIKEMPDESPGAGPVSGAKVSHGVNGNGATPEAATLAAIDALIDTQTPE